MGCYNSTLRDDGGSRASHSIDEEIKKSKREFNNTTKALMIGPGESGKSTIVKQLRLAYSRPYSLEERLEYKEVVCANTLQSMQVVLQGFLIVGISFPPHLDFPALVLENLEVEQALTAGAGDFHPEVARAIWNLWEDPSTKEVVRQSAKFQLNDSAAYFFDAIPRTSATGYVPEDLDILRCRVQTTGIVEESFTVGKHKMTVVDVGGQRSERKKWIHCFEGVQLLIFVAAISEFDQFLYEDERQPRMAETLVLWDSIATSPWFSRTSLILFLNKVDLLEHKVLNHPESVERYLPEYRGSSNDIESVKRYLLIRFKSFHHNQERTLFTHFTCATDTTMMRPVLRAVMEAVITSALSDGGFL